MLVRVFQNTIDLNRLSDRKFKSLSALRCKHYGSILHDTTFTLQKRGMNIKWFNHEQIFARRKLREMTQSSAEMFVFHASASFFSSICSTFGYSGGAVVGIGQVSSSLNIPHPHTAAHHKRAVVGGFHRRCQ